MAERATLTPGVDSADDIREELRRLESVYTDWHSWIGVGGILYARRVLSSPAKIVRGADTAALWAEVRRVATGQVSGVRGPDGDRGENEGKHR